MAISTSTFIMDLKNSLNLPLVTQNGWTEKKIKCPYKKKRCQNTTFRKVDDVKVHLVRWGFVITSIGDKGEEAILLGGVQIGTSNNWTMMNKFHPVGEDGESTYGKTTQLHKKIAERVEELSHAASDSTDPPPAVDMSQVFLEIVEPRKGRVIGLGNLAPTRIGSTSSASISSNIDPAVLDSLFEERFGERLVKMQQEMQERMNEHITLAVQRALSGHQMMDNPPQQNVNGSDGHDDDFGG